MQKCSFTVIYRYKALQALLPPFWWSGWSLSCTCIVWNPCREKLGCRTRPSIHISKNARLQLSPINATSSSIPPSRDLMLPMFRGKNTSKALHFGRHFSSAALLQLIYIWGLFLKMSWSLENSIFLHVNNFLLSWMFNKTMLKTARITRRNPPGWTTSKPEMKNVQLENSSVRINE